MGGAVTPLASITLHLLAHEDGTISRRSDTSRCTVDPSVMAGALRELADDLDAVAARHEARKAGLVVGPEVAQA